MTSRTPETMLQYKSRIVPDDVWINVDTCEENSLILQERNAAGVIIRSSSIHQFGIISLIYILYVRSFFIFKRVITSLAILFILWRHFPYCCTFLFYIHHHISWVGLGWVSKRI